MTGFMGPPCKRKEEGHYGRRSPDVHALLRREVELVPGLHVEGFVPRVQVADGGDAIRLRRVAVALHHLAQGLVVRRGTPAAREADEELPIARPQRLWIQPR